MAKQKVGLTAEEHENLGLILYEMNITIQEIIVQLGARYRKDSRGVSNAWSILGSLNKLRSALDDDFIRNHPDAPRGNWVHSPYYRRGS